MEDECQHGTVTGGSDGRGTPAAALWMGISKLREAVAVLRLRLISHLARPPVAAQQLRHMTIPAAAQAQKKQPQEQQAELQQQQRQQQQQQQAVRQGPPQVRATDDGYVVFPVQCPELRPLVQQVQHQQELRSSAWTT
ncbi:hypothetical protein Efla_006684 [Eimeria flavescens]